VNRTNLLPIIEDKVSKVSLGKDYIYTFEGLWEKPGECRIRLYQEKDSPTVIICSEIPSNQGGSVTTIAEGLANAIWRLEGKPDPFIWIEYYSTELSSNGKETFDKVSFLKTPEGRFFSPQWNTMTRQDVEKLVGQSI
jgi:hypothetical protein